MIRHRCPASDYNCSNYRPTIYSVSHFDNKNRQWVQLNPVQITSQNACCGRRRAPNTEICIRCHKVNPQHLPRNKEKRHPFILRECDHKCSGPRSEYSYDHPIHGLMGEYVSKCKYSSKEHQRTRSRSPEQTKVHFLHCNRSVRHNIEKKINKFENFQTNLDSVRYSKLPKRSPERKSHSHISRSCTENKHDALEIDNYTPKAYNSEPINKYYDSSPQNCAVCENAICSKCNKIRGESPVKQGEVAKNAECRNTIVRWKHKKQNFDSGKNTGNLCCEEWDSRILPNTQKDKNIVVRSRSGSSKGLANRKDSCDSLEKSDESTSDVSLSCDKCEACIQQTKIKRRSKPLFTFKQDGSVMSKSELKYPLLNSTISGVLDLIRDKSSSQVPTRTSGEKIGSSYTCPYGDWYRSFMGPTFEESLLTAFQLIKPSE